MLKSFVSDVDYPRLIDFLKKVQSDTLRKEVSIVQIFGAGNNGKTTFIQFLSKLNTAQRFCFENIYNRGFEGRYSNPDLSAFEKSMAISYDHGYSDTEKMLSRFHREVYKHGIVDSMKEIHIANPGVLIIHTNKLYEIETYPIRRRRPLYFHFPNTFKYDPNVDIVEQCLKEFNEIMHQ